MKRIAKEGRTLDRLRAAVGPDADVEPLVVFETVALNQLPLRKEHFIYKGAVAQDGFMREMAARLNEESLPLHVEHVGGQDGPKGRAFYGEVVPGEGGSELRALFFLNENTHGREVELIETGVVDQVSVNVLPKSLTCSACGFDFLADGHSAALYEGVCANDHRVRDDMHFELAALDRFSELSLVSRGGAQNARIQGPRTAVLSASGGDRTPHLEALVLTASPTLPEKKAVTTENKDEAAEGGVLALATRLAEVTVELTAANAAKEAAEAALAEAKAAKEAAEARVAELEQAGAAETAARLQAAEAAAGKVLDHLKDQDRKLRIALGERDPNPEGDAEALIASIAASQTKLSSLFVPGGVSRPADAGAGERPRRVSSGAFSAPRR